MRNLWVGLLLGLGICLGAGAQAAPGISGQVRDGVGRAVAGASVRLTALAGGAALTATTGADGTFTIATPPPGRYTLAVSEPSFAAYTSVIEVGTAPPPPLQVTLDLAPMQQSLVVTATGVATPQTQLGQSVDVLGQAEIQARAGLTADESLRELPSVQVVRDGAVGGATDVMLRGGDPSFSKIMLDGVPVQRFDFGAYDFSTLTPEALDSITVVRGADSVVYGSDAAAGVIDMRSRSGAGLGSPDLTLTTIAGSFATSQEVAQLAGSWRPLDYAFSFGYLDTDNQIPNNKYWNQSWSGNVGLRLPYRIQARFNLHYINTRAGDPNAFDFFGIADDSFQWQGETYGSLRLEQATTSHWQNTVTLSQSSVNYFYQTITPTGEPYNGNYLGNPVTIIGANGYTASGQAILDYGGAFPEGYASDTLGRYVNATSEYTFSPLGKLVVGYRYGDEQGVSTPVERWHDNGEFAEVSDGIWNRVFGSAGISEDEHSQFGDTFNPQASLAVLPRLNRGGWWDEIRLHANAATAQVDPTITEAQSSLYALVLASGGSSDASSLHVGPILPQRAHTFDAGADQYLFHDRLRASITGFDDRYYDLIQFVPSTAFGELGLSPAVTDAVAADGGAYLNSWSESSKGAEMELQARQGGWHGSVSYTYLIPLVLSSYSSDAVAPSFNPAYPTIPIGAFSPLVGARPFHVAPESGNIVAGYGTARWSLDANAYGSSRRDDSTFLTDGNYGTTMLLPNHDLAPAYATANLSGFYQLNSRITLEGVVDNLFNRDYQEVFGYPALGRAVRVGVRWSLTRPRS